MRPLSYAQALFQPGTQMAHTMQIHGSNPTLDAHPKLTYHAGAFTYTVETDAGSTQYTVSDANQSISLPVFWTMGAEAQPWILQRNGRRYESLVSYYPAIQGLDITTGDGRIHPTTLEEAIGRSFGDEDTKACFGCHATNPVTDHKLTLSTLIPGVTCEHCHTGSAVHMTSMLHGDDTKLPP